MGEMQQETVMVQATVVIERELSILVDDGNVRCWLPKSAIVTGICDGDYLLNSHVYAIEVPERMAHNKGLV